MGADSSPPHPHQKSPQRNHLLLLCGSQCMLGVGRRGQGGSPDAHRGLDEGGDAHAGEDRTDELADHVLVPAHTQRLSQKEGHSNGATEACQVMLGEGERVHEAGRQGSQGNRATRTTLMPASGGLNPCCPWQGARPGLTFLQGIPRKLPFSSLFGVLICPQVISVASVEWVLSPVTDLLPGRRHIFPGIIFSQPHQNPPSPSQLGNSHCC